MSFIQFDSKDTKNLLTLLGEYEYILCIAIHIARCDCMHLGLNLHCRVQFYIYTENIYFGKHLFAYHLNNKSTTSHSITAKLSNKTVIAIAIIIL